MDEGATRHLNQHHHHHHHHQQQHSRTTQLHTFFFFLLFIVILRIWEPGEKLCIARRFSCLLYAMPGRPLQRVLRHFTIPRGRNWSSSALQKKLTSERFASLGVLLVRFDGSWMALRLSIFCSIFLPSFRCLYHHHHAEEEREGKGAEL